MGWWTEGEYLEIESLLGKTLKEVKVSDDQTEIRFVTQEDEVYKMYHEQDCCEHVQIEEIVGDLKDLIGTNILEARATTNSDQWNVEEADDDYIPDSFTWTFYHLATIKGWVTIRWLGTSNGYYSESVSFIKLPKENNGN